MEVNEEKHMESQCDLLSFPFIFFNAPIWLLSHASGGSVCQEEEVSKERPPYHRVFKELYRYGSGKWLALASNRHVFCGGGKGLSEAIHLDFANLDWQGQ